MAIIPPYPSRTQKLAVFTNSVFADHKQDVDAILEYFDTKDADRFFFRGMSKASYKLYTSGQRFRILNDIHVKSKDDLSMYMGMFYRTRQVRNGAVAELMRASGIHKQDDIALFSYMQHHSGPTPFLDLTEDPFVALYFATEDTVLSRAENELDMYFSVYCVPRSLEEVFNRAWSAARVDWNVPPESPMMVNYASFWQGKIIVMREPWVRETFGDNVGHLRNSLNVINQKGLFIFNGSADLPLVEAIQDYERITNAASIPGYLASNAFKCFNIHNSLAAYVRERLAARTPALTKSYIYPSAEDIFKDVKTAFLRDLRDG